MMANTVLANFSRKRLSQPALDALIQDEIWQEYNMVSMIKDTFQNRLESATASTPQVFVFKKTAITFRGQLTTVTQSAEKAPYFGCRC